MASSWSTLVARFASDPTTTYPAFRDLVMGLSRLLQFQTGSVTGTGALIDVETEGDPKGVILVNITAQSFAFNCAGMADDSAIVSDVGGGNALDVADMIILGTDGFSIGSDVLINGVGDEIFWVAFI